MHEQHFKSYFTHFVCGKISIRETISCWKSSLTIRLRTTHKTYRSHIHVKIIYSNGVHVSKCVVGCNSCWQHHLSIHIKCIFLCHFLSFFIHVSLFRSVGNNKLGIVIISHFNYVSYVDYYYEYKLQRVFKNGSNKLEWNS